MILGFFTVLSSAALIKISALLLLAMFVISTMWKKNKLNCESIAILLKRWIYCFKNMCFDMKLACAQMNLQFAQQNCSKEAMPWYHINRLSPHQANT